MAQHKWEQDFREKLNGREIAPSAAAWDRLDAMLTVAEKPKKRYGWLYMAASIVGFLCIGIAYFSQTQEMTDVGRENPTVTFEQKSPTTPAPIQENTGMPSTANPVAVASPTHPSSIKKVQSGGGIHQPAVQNPEPPQTGQSIDNPTHETQAVAENKPEPVLQNTPKKAIEVNVDELLASVTKGKQKTPGMSSVQVNPNSLLNQVDNEITLTFRERMIKTVNHKYQNVRVALANRNKE